MVAKNIRFVNLGHSLICNLQLQRYKIAQEAKAKRMDRQTRTEDNPTPLDLISFVPFACKRLEAPFNVLVKERTDADPKERKSKQSKRESNPPQSQASVEVPSKTSYTPPDPKTITVMAVRDALGRINHLIFCRCKKIPLLLLRILGLCMPYHLYLTKISIRWGPSRGFALKEIANFLSQSYLTDVSLDDSPLPQRNFHILLEANTPLRRLSLARCDIDDEVCALFVSKLAYPQPASESLVSLSLTSNFITDIGATAIGNTLRSNRSLLHIDLAGNYITDAGAAIMLETLMNFPLTEEEVTMMNKRRLQHLLLHIQEDCARVIATQTLARNAGRSQQQRKGKARRARKGSISSIHDNASAQDIGAGKNELGETPSDPFSVDQTYSRNGQVFSMGNMRLAFLNMAYNRLELGSAKLLHCVLSYQTAKKQAEVGEASVHRGLVRIVLDGNPMPKHCEQLQKVKELLEQTVIVKPTRMRHKRASR